LVARRCPCADFERALAQVQTYLRGDSVDIDGYAIVCRAGRAAKVPVSVAATGPRVIALAARLVERGDVLGRRRGRPDYREAITVARSTQHAESLGHSS